MFALLRWTVLRPLKSLDAQAASLGAGDLETPIGLLSIDELGRLAETLNAMRKNLKLSYEEVQAQNEELKELDRLKDEFLANVTHELKTPLNGVSDSPVLSAMAPMAIYLRHYMSLWPQSIAPPSGYSICQIRYSPSPSTVIKPRVLNAMRSSSVPTSSV